jgi:hypothetical protein
MTRKDWRWGGLMRRMLFHFIGFARFHAVKSEKPKVAKAARNATTASNALSRSFMTKSPVNINAWRFSPPGSSVFVLSGLFLLSPSQEFLNVDRRSK